MLPLTAYKLVRPELRGERRRYVVGLGLIVLTAAFAVSVPNILAAAIDRIDQGHDYALSLVGPILFAMIGAVLLRGLTQFYMRMNVVGASRRIELGLRKRLFEKLQSMDPAYFQATHTGDLMSRFTSDVESVRMTVGPGTMYLANSTFMFTFAVIAMLSASPLLTVTAVVPLLLLTASFRFLGPRVHAEFTLAQEKLSQISVLAQEDFSHQNVIKAFAREGSEHARMERESDEYFDQNMQLARTRALTHSLLMLFGDLLIFALVAAGGWGIITERITLSEFVIFQGCQLLLVWPMIALGWVLALFQRGAASASRLAEIIDTMPEIDDRNAVPGARPTAGSVSFEKVRFRHRDTDARLLETGDADGGMVLDGIDLVVPGGKTLGIVGPTGSGKTTLLSLIPRLHTPSGGSLSIDARPVDEYPLAELRRRVALVPQEPFLFSTTIADNIAFAAGDVDERLVHEVARLVGIHDEIERFPKGYATRVGERGITLSGGQKQRIALARALLTRPRLLLLDDVLSAVDAETETHILNGLRKFTEAQTVVIVSHRLSAVRDADEIIVLEEGKIADRGVHSELITRPGFYLDLHKRQTLEGELKDL